jgi:hypothetical protein
MPHWPMLRPKPQTTPVSVSTGGTPPRKLSKVVAPRDADALFPEAINAKVLLTNQETVIGVSAEGFERGVGEVDGCL